MIERTVLIIKPDVNDDFGDEIIEDVKKLKFKVLNKKEITLDHDSVKLVFSSHMKTVSEHFIGFMTSKPVTVILLEKRNAIKDLKKEVGDKNSRHAEPGTIRRLYGVDSEHNAVYCSESLKEADWDIRFFFPD